MTIFAESSQDLAEQNATLTEKLEEGGVDPDTIADVAGDDDADDTDDANDADDVNDVDDTNDVDDADDSTDTE
jgi:hypothetical protein